MAGDNDSTGRHYAEMASQLVNGTVIYPPESGTDWNDFLTQEVTA